MINNYFSGALSSPTFLYTDQCYKQWSGPIYQACMRKAAMSSLKKECMPILHVSITLSWEFWSMKSEPDHSSNAQLFHHLFSHPRVGPSILWRISLITINEMTSGSKGLSFWVLWLFLRQCTQKCYLFSAPTPRKVFLKLQPKGKIGTATCTSTLAFMVINFPKW